MTRKEIEEAYAISRRIEAEERCAGTVCVCMCVPLRADPRGSSPLEQRWRGRGRAAPFSYTCMPPFRPALRSPGLCATPQPTQPRSCLDNAVMVFTSTRQEVDEQWGL